MHLMSQFTQRVHGIRSPSIPGRTSSSSQRLRGRQEVPRQWMHQAVPCLSCLGLFWIGFSSWKATLSLSLRSPNFTYIETSEIGRANRPDRLIQHTQVAPDCLLFAGAVDSGQADPLPSGIKASLECDTSQGLFQSHCPWSILVVKALLTLAEWAGHPSLIRFHDSYAVAGLDIQEPFQVSELLDYRA